jgi:hypothetical protein
MLLHYYFLSDSEAAYIHMCIEPKDVKYYSENIITGPLHVRRIIAVDVN